MTVWQAVLTKTTRKWRTLEVRTGEIKEFTREGQPNRAQEHQQVPTETQLDYLVWTIPAFMSF
jgi:hypothetical protein